MDPPFNFLPLLLAGLVAFAVYRDAAERKGARGSTPWGWAPEVWGVVGFFLGLFGALIYFVASRAHDRKRVESAPTRRPFVL